MTLLLQEQTVFYPFISSSMPINREANDDFGHKAPLMTGVGTAQIPKDACDRAPRSYHNDAAISGELPVCASSAPSVTITDLKGLC
jgi:hypothetical protein